MKRYIDGTALLNKYNCGNMTANEMYQALVEAPSVDVVEVCRCHECKYGDNGIQKQEVYTVCNRFGNGILKMSPLDFCSYGERRKENGQ